MESCKKILGIDLSNKQTFEVDTSNAINSITDTYINRKEMDILNKLKSGKNFKNSFRNQNIHFILDANIPFILITPSHIEKNRH